ncbi:yjeF C-terminal region, hydroxyethylthiazole kinase-related/yjeF N-terminal region [Propionibacterium cyclohexanicum]|uniref:ADP-dependent (S)-NAD(P)H-hydrate dehydratase n=1 Tax=Propionibacterium cyclohexanicum TaxID=64702 RepID=A0A1H9S8V9_9ACTN|nr:NAD(P)H-hydrate epimerase [Propionibacterium cyclohexanicum]SER80803.1 yjeF C-terminal region, hydroxyethylthiazole kinase-related/yjeF N-terminal region [Propionibacterium cyclohexanicum]
MKSVATVEQIRAAEQAWFAAHPGEDLMRVAAGHVAASAMEMLGAVPGRVLVVAGRGDNGGDGLFAACDLIRAGCHVAVWCTSSHWHPAGHQAALSAGCAMVEPVDAIEGLPEVDLVIDAVLGIGGRPGLDPVVAQFARACADLEVPVLSVDLPSGLAADGVGWQERDCFRATRTITFGALKLCHVAQPAAGHCGQVEVADIGIALGEPRIQLAEPADVAMRWPVPDARSDKYSRGVLGLDTGSQRFPGAGVLSTLGALEAGAGMLRFCGAPASAAIIATTMPSVTFGAGRVQAWVAGCGWGNGDRARLDAVLAHGRPAVIDADALSVLPRTMPAGCLLTPHAGELAALLGIDRSAVAADPLGAAREAARRHQAVVLLKGASQYIAEPDGRISIAVPGPAWTAQAGSGDCLAGVCGTLLAAGLDARWAALLGASVQALAALDMPGPHPPDVLARHFPQLIAQLVATAPVDRRAGVRDVDLGTG